METLKKPETVITLINTAALLGASVYFYRRINVLEQEIDKHTEHLTSTIKKVKEMQVTKEHVKQLAGAIRELNNIIGGQRNEIIQLKHFSNFYKEQIKELQESTTGLGGEVKLTKIPVISPVQFHPRNRYNQSQGYNQPLQQGYNQSQGYNQPLQQGYNQPQQRYNQSQQGLGFNEQFEKQNRQGFNMNSQPSFGFNSNQTFQQQNNSGYNQDQFYHPAQDLIDLNLMNNPEEDDIDSEIEAVRRARQNTNTGLEL
uniref:Uncharacterized protein n=1 Tax=Pithovirus LCPAC302 TaxID=2506593 RepID=A0A481Z710_9VIRU|nr:MAG: protein of unknown function DUF1664 [Pithovirus LCPAC302]